MRLSLPVSKRITVRYRWESTIHLISRAKKAHLISLVLISNNNASNRMFHFEIIQISSPRYDTSYFVFQFQMAWFMSYQIEKLINLEEVFRYYTL